MPKVTVSVPEDVFAAMQAARTRSGPNWSAIATAAFQQALQQLKEARSTMGPAAVRLPFPTTGDFEVFEVRRGRERYEVKVSGTVCAPNYYFHRKLARIVSAFAEEVLSEHPDLEDGSTLPRMLTSTAAERIAAEL